MGSTSVGPGSGSGWLHACVVILVLQVVALVMQNESMSANNLGQKEAVQTTV